MSEAFKVAVRHSFNDHEGCDKEWCRSLSDDEATRSQAFKRLPYGKALFGTVLLRLILGLFDVVGSVKVCIGGWHMVGTRRIASRYTI